MHKDGSITSDGPTAEAMHIRTPAPRDHTHPQSTEYLVTPGRPPNVFDIGSVKLKTVDMMRSPGGTPLRPTRKTADPNDPASIIAQALRRKFSHKVFRDSPDKENLDSSNTSLPPGFESPTVKFLK